MEKSLKILNTIAIAVPVLFVIIEMSIYGMALVSTMFTGALQVIIGIIFWLRNKKNPFIISYLILTALFFALLKVDGIGNWCWIMPPVLCIYLSVIIYTQKSKP